MKTNYVTKFRNTKFISFETKIQTKSHLHYLAYVFEPKVLKDSKNISKLINMILENDTD